MPADYAIDQALFDIAVASLPPPPAIMRPFFDSTGEFGALLEHHAEEFAEHRRYSDSWREQTDKNMEELRLAMSLHPVMPHHLEALTILATKMEELAEQSASGSRGLRKTLTKIEKRLASGLYPQQKKALAQLHAELMGFREAEMDDFLHVALCCRALRAEHDPDSRKGPTFDDPAELERYIASLVA